MFNSEPFLGHPTISLKGHGFNNLESTVFKGYISNFTNPSIVILEKIKKNCLYEILNSSWGPSFNPVVTLLTINNLHYLRILAEGSHKLWHCSS